MGLRLVKITDDNVVFELNGKILGKPLDPEAKKVLKWNHKNIPAND